MGAVEAENSKIVLLHPLGSNSPVESFLKKNPSGGVHHICYEVKDINKATEKLFKLSNWSRPWTRLFPPFTILRLIDDAIRQLV